MIKTSEIRARLHAAICGIPELIVELGGDVTAIVEYVEEENGDLFSTIVGMRAASILIAAQGNGPSGNAMRFRAHRFSIILKPKGDPFELEDLMLNGFTQASGFDLGLPLKDLTIHPLYHQMETPTMERRSIAVDAKSNFDYWELVTSFLSRGAE